MTPETRSEVPAAAPAGYGRELIRPTWARRAKWRVETAAYVILETALGWLPITWVARIGRVLGAMAGAVLAGRRRIVARNLRIAFAGEKRAEEQRELTAEVWRRCGANLLCALRTADMGNRSLGRIIEVRDEAVMREAAGRGKGVVIILAHMGNWEALAQWFRRILPEGMPGATVYRPLNNPVMNARVAAARARHGLTLFSKDDNPLGMAGFLRRGGALAVLADQRAGKIGELVPFFGRNTSCTPIPAILARRTGAAIVGLSVSTLGPGRWELRWHAAEQGEPSTAGVMALVERMMRVSPADVFWLQDRWRVERATPHRPAGKAPRGETRAATKRRRALLWKNAAGLVAAAPAAVPDDVDHETAERGAGETVEAFLRRVDGAAELPLEYVVGGVEEAGLRQACRRLGIGWTKEAKR